MADVPPPEAFDPQPGDGQPAGRLRRRLQVALTLLVVAALVVLAAVEGGGYLLRGDASDATPATADAPRIAAVDAAGLLTTIDSRDGAVVAYPVAGVTFRFPVWSPDGTRVAALGESPEGMGVYVLAARSGTQRAIDPIVIYRSVDRPPFYLYWTPDGAQLTFLTTEPDGLALRIVAANEGATDSIVRSGAPMYWDFVDAGRLLVHSGPSGPTGFQGEVAVNGAPFADTLRTPGGFRAPAVSADGLYRAYQAALDGTSEVVLESRAEAGTRRIRVFGPSAFAFEPDGDRLAFVGLDQPTSDDLPLPVGPLRLLDPETATPRTLLDGSVVAFFWSPTGREIAAFLIPDPDDDVIEADARGTVVLASQEAVAGIPLRLAFVQVADGSIRSEREVRVSDLFVNQVLPYYDQYARSHRVWSPDGAGIVLPLVGAGDVTELVVIPADGSESRVIATGEMGFWSP